jgi:hypothetical protein
MRLDLVGTKVCLDEDRGLPKRSAIGLREKGLRLKRLFLTTPRDLYKTCFKRQANSRYVSIVKYYGAREGLKENGPVW